MNNHAPIIRPIRTTEDLHLLKVAMAADQHQALYPTHSVIKGGQIVGALGVLSMPVVTWWMHRTGTNVKDSLLVRSVAETLIAQNPAITDYVMPCQDDSPYYAHMSRLGYEFIGKTSLFRKGL